MFHLAPVRLWRNISIVMAVAAGIAALAGTFFADGSIAVHWSGSGDRKRFYHICVDCIF